MPKISHDLFSHAQKWQNFLKILHRYIDFAYLLLANYLRILTHPIINFLHFSHCIQFFSYTSRKKIILRANGGVLTPKLPLAYASDFGTRVPPVFKPD